MYFIKPAKSVVLNPKNSRVRHKTIYYHYKKNYMRIFLGISMKISRNLIFLQILILILKKIPL